MEKVLTFIQKLIIFWAAIVLSAFQRIFFPYSLEFSFYMPKSEMVLNLFYGVILLMLPIAFWGWFVYIVYMDAQEIGANENWWIASLLLGPLGATIYYFKTKEKRN